MEHIHILFQGQNFSPRLFKQDIDFCIKSLAEAGELAARGRHKGQPSPYGLATLKIEDDNIENLFLQFVSCIRNLQMDAKILRKHKIEDVYLDIEDFERIGLEVPADVEKSLKDLNFVLQPELPAQ